MIHCQECGADNMVGAIFCRSCGAKLNLNEIRPETEMKKQASVTKNLKTVVGRIVALVVLVALGGILAGLLLPAPGSVVGQLDDREMQRAVARARQMFATRRQRAFTFSSEEITALANKLFRLDGETGATAEGEAEQESGGAGLRPEHLSIQLLSSGYVKIVLRSRFMGKLPIYCTLLGNFEAKEDGGVGFELFSAAMGKLSLPGPLQDTVLARFQALLATEPKLQNFIARIVLIDVEEDKVTLTVK
ncbi:MAG: zinc ribbon domain-containing protein [Kiritimatiellaeota bacterium]|nr:zinc ribbon domain-containing protein [Kiritimatiellota bacterium]